MEGTGIQRETLTRRQRASWRVKTTWAWLRGRSSFDGKTKYIRARTYG